MRDGEDHAMVHGGVEAQIEKAIEVFGVAGWTIRSAQEKTA